MKSDCSPYTQRITKSLSYVKMPERERPSLPLTELMIDKLHENREKQLEWLQMHEAAEISLSASVTPSSVIVALIYIERIKVYDPDYFISSSPSDLFVISLLLAGKYLYDVGVVHESFNEFWATHACKPIDLINKEEMSFLQAINWNLYVDPATFFAMLENVEANTAEKEGMKRGFFTYTDLSSIKFPHIAPLFGIVCSTLSFCIVSYTLTLLATTSVVMGVAEIVRRSTATEDLVCLPTQCKSTPLSKDTENINVTEIVVKEAIDLFNDESEECQKSSPPFTQFNSITILTDVVLWLLSPSSGHENKTDKNSVKIGFKNNWIERYNESPVKIKNYIEMHSDRRKIQNTMKCNIPISNLYSNYYIERNNFSIGTNPIVS